MVYQRFSIDFINRGASHIFVHILKPNTFLYERIYHVIFQRAHHQQGTRRRVQRGGASRLHHLEPATENTHRTGENRGEGYQNTPPKKANTPALRHPRRRLLLLSRTVYRRTLGTVRDRHRPSGFRRGSRSVARPPVCRRETEPRPHLRKPRRQRGETVRPLSHQPDTEPRTVFRRCPARRLGVSGMETRTEGGRRKCRSFARLLSGT